MVEPFLNGTTPNDVTDTATSGAVDATLIGRCQELEEKVADLKARKAIRDTRQAFESRQANIQSAVNQLRPLGQQYKALQARGIKVDVPDEVLRLRHEYARALNEFHTDPLSLTKPNALPTTLLSNGAVKLSQNLKTSWTDYTASQKVALDEGLLTILENVPSFKTTIASVRLLKNRLESLRQTVPSSEDDIDSFLRVAASLHQKWGELQSQDIPEEVQCFLRAMGQGGATLDLLTETVRVWLQAQGLEKSFYVVSA